MAPIDLPDPATRSRARAFAFACSFVVLLGLAIFAAIVPPFGAQRATARAPEPTPIVSVHPHRLPSRGAAAHHPTEPKPSPSSPSTMDKLIAMGQPIFCGAGTKPLVALTFDDGPGVLTPDALTQLRAHHDVATFFLVGKLVKQGWLAPDLRKETRFPGAAFGDHTWDHVAVTKATNRFLNEQILRTRRAIEHATHQQVQLFRPPLGEHDANLDRYLRAHHMLQILWSIDSQDSQGARAQKIYRIVRNNLSPGDIILLHDNRGTTEKALPRILDLIDRQGLTTVTVPELMAQDPPSAKQVRQHTCP